jgi:Rab GDP dissociation inhibitor
MLMMKKYNLDDSTMDMVGHSLALYPDESWKTDPAKNVIERVKLYGDSLRAYGRSPYLYPVYGLGDLPQSFARLSAIYGGTYMLNTKVDGFTFDEVTGKVNGVRSGDQVAKCSLVVGDPSYFPDRVQKVGEIIRCMAILDHPVEGTDKSESLQIVIPQNQVKRKSDIYVSVVSSAHSVAPKGKYLAIVSTTVETNNPKAELEPGFKWLGNTLQRFYKVYPMYVPTNDWKKEAVHVSKSYDASSHFDSMADDVIRIFKNIMDGADVSYILKPKEKKPGEEGAGQ